MDDAHARKKREWGRKKPRRKWPLNAWPHLKHLKEPVQPTTSLSFSLKSDLEGESESDPPQRILGNVVSVSFWALQLLSFTVSKQLQNKATVLRENCKSGSLCLFFSTNLPKEILLCISIVLWNPWINKPGLSLTMVTLALPRRTNQSYAVNH